MSPIWIVIIGLSILSTLLVVGLVLWWGRIEQQEEHSLTKLRSAKETIKALPGDQKEERVEVINRVLSEMPFPLQTYAADIKARTEIESILDDVISELKQDKKPPTPAI